MCCTTPCTPAACPATVFLTCLFTLPSVLAAFLKLPREVFDTVEEMVQAGWRVD